MIANTLWKAARDRRLLPDQFAGKLIRSFLRPASRRSGRILGGPLRGTKWMPSSMHLSCWLGIYEAEKAQCCCRLVKPGAILLDLGANVGYFTLLAAGLVGPAGRVWAFEPLDANVRLLKQHLVLNGVRNATLIRGAVADYCGTASFDDSLGGVASRLSKQGTSRVPVFSIDSLVQQRTIHAPDYMKIDVEGAEMSVLRGAQETLAATHPTLFIDTHGEMIHQECLAFLAQLGYSLEPLDRRQTLKDCREFVALHPVRHLASSTP